MSFESSAFHEAGHAAVMLLSEDTIGAPTLISALAEGNRLGFVLPSNDALQDLSPEAVRAYGRMLTAGAMAQSLAGFEEYAPGFGAVGAGGDAEKLSRLARLAGRGKDFARECTDGAEWMLRLHWGGVVAIVGALRACGGALEGKTGIDYARTLLHQKPTRPLGVNMETIERLATSLVSVPEFAGPIKKAIATYYAPPAKGRANAKGAKPASTRGPL